MGPCILDTEHSLRPEHGNPQGGLSPAGCLHLSYGAVFIQNVTEDPESFVPGLHIPGGMAQCRADRGHARRGTSLGPARRKLSESDWKGVNVAR